MGRQLLWVILSYGLLAAWSPEYREILGQDHGIEVRAGAACVVSSDLIRYVGEYNETMEGRITAVHGADVFEKTVQKACMRFDDRVKDDSLAPD